MTKLRKTAIIATSIILSASLYQRVTQSYVFSRVFRTILCGIHILWAYKISFNQTNYLDIHESVAKDIYQTCLKNDGLYVKLGQGVAALDHLLPPPFYKYMHKLQDQAQTVQYKKIQKLFKQQIGKQISQCFNNFQKQPIASASIAQVHKAQLKNGNIVAIKIQKPNIKKQFKIDMLMHYLLIFILEKSFNMPLLHFVQDIQNNLKKQLDFRIQANNAKQAYKNFQLLKRNQLYIPQIIDEFTRQRVMVSQWIDGIKITQDQQLHKLGFNKKQIMNHLIRAFSDQIFITGFVHCDPHPGNVFIRPHPKNNKQFQIVILDHGLCLKLSNQFRIQYAQFWKYMFLGNISKMKSVCKKWNITMTDQFAGVQLFRPYNQKKLLTQKVQQKDVLKLQYQMKNKLKQMMKESINYPKQLIFVGRNMNLVRSLNKYHGGISDRITIMARSAYIGAQTQLSSKPKSGISYNIQSLHFNCRLKLLQLYNWLKKTLTGLTIQQQIQNQTAKQTKNMFQSYGFKSMDQNAYNA